jgi:ferredoxin--NADP+ reductase
VTLIARPLPGHPERVPPLPWDNATLLRRDDLSKRMASFHVGLDTASAPFNPGQYVALGLRDDDRVIQRPYSIVSAPGAASELEFLVRRLDDGILTPRLWAARPGTRLRVGAPKGLFTLDRDDRRRRIFIASGTGLAPFISILAAVARIGTAEPVLLLHGASQPSELAYGERITAWQSAGVPIEYLPTVSRPDSGVSGTWRGHRGRVESLLAELCRQRSLDPVSSVAYLCGNPGTINACEAVLATAGFGPAELHVERYQPAAR